MDCGVATFAMIAEHYGRKLNLEEIRNSCSLNREGVSLLSLSKTAERYGFKTVGGIISIDDITNKKVLPCILHWDQDHFVVLSKIKRKGKSKRFIILDPAIGEQSYGLNEFCGHWLSIKTEGRESGVALLLEPTSTFFVWRMLIRETLLIEQPSSGDISRSTAGILVRSYWALSLVR